MPKALARLFHRTGQSAKAVQVLQAHLSNFPGQASGGCWCAKEREGRCGVVWCLAAMP